MALGVILFGLGIVAWYGWRLTAEEPRWWGPADAVDASTIALGEEIENSIVTQVHRVRPASSEEWTFDLDEEAVNAWLATRFPAWARNRGMPWAGQISELHARLDGDRLRVGLRYGAGAGMRTLSIEARPALDEAGGLRLELLRTAVGRLPVPATTAAGMLELSGASTEVDAIISGRPVDPVFRLGDGRQVRLVGLELEAGRLRLLLRTGP